MTGNDKITRIAYALGGTKRLDSTNVFVPNVPEKFLYIKSHRERQRTNGHKIPISAVFSKMKIVSKRIEDDSSLKSSDHTWIHE